MLPMKFNLLKFLPLSANICKASLLVPRRKHSLEAAEIGRNTCIHGCRIQGSPLRFTAATCAVHVRPRLIPKPKIDRHGGRLIPNIELLGQLHGKVDQVSLTQHDF